MEALTEQDRIDQEGTQDALRTHGYLDDPDKRLNPMDPTTKQKWLSALRSGNYQQGEGKLKITNEDNSELFYCCLGVLCEIKGLDTEPGLLREPEGGEAFWDYQFVFPQSSGGDTWMVKQSSMPMEDWMVNECGLEQRHAEVLAAMNDNGVSFEGIANWIEANL